jgi:hypothetical protein
MISTPERGLDLARQACGFLMPPTEVSFSDSLIAFLDATEGRRALRTTDLFVHRSAGHFEPGPAMAKAIRRFISNG